MVTQKSFRKGCASVMDVILCCPKICLIITIQAIWCWTGPHRRPRPRVRQQRPRRPRPETPPLPPRARALTIPLMNPEDGQVTLSQSQSAFFSKLPLELRRMIYDRALGLSTAHLMYACPRIWARRCTLEGCRHAGIDRRDGETSFGVSLALLRACRQMYVRSPALTGMNQLCGRYSEAIESLYSSNTFSISTQAYGAHTISKIPLFFQPQRVVQIRKLHICWDLLDAGLDLIKPVEHHFPLPSWLKTWKIISDMAGLRELLIEFTYTYPPTSRYTFEFWMEHQIEIFEPVKCVVSPSTFVITLPYRELSTDLDVAPSSCIFRPPAQDPFLQV
ncbi:hypothetical protein BCR34DRAFT_560340 [Clohesyomyces aquaticus]|uniref:DUF7730 domain-containing protein n=1 Tax=Clohesyomyces aquaticus TaxID=1231657 RepID=A0A1Y1ZVZ6_9PLEO|nr:hypothetical protein BCR34DRAFT_560340 [Clohesyomyces aquaticus]